MHIEHAGWLPFGLALGLLAGCPGELPNKAEYEAYAAAHPEAGAPSQAGTGPVAGSASSDACGDVPARIFVTTCGGNACHGGAAPQQGLDLVSPGVAERVVGVSAKMCTQLLADPQNPEQSLMYQKLFTKPACGAQMPLAKPPLASADIACILSWIAAQ